MAFADHNEDGLIYYMLISGIPNVFSNHDLPAAWLTGGFVVIDGRNYTPSKTLLTSAGSSFTYKNSIEAKSGLGKSSGMNVEFSLDDTWLDLTSIHIYRSGGNKYTIMGDADVVPGDTTIPVDSTTDASATDIWYAGLETMEVDSVDTAQTVTATRGLYGSQQRRFAGLTDGALETGSFGAWVLDHPGVWEGRQVQIFMGTGEWGTVFTPYGATIGTAEDKRIFLGTISGLDISSDTERVVMSLQPLDRLLSEAVGFRMPTIDAGHRTTAQLPVDGESDLVTMTIWEADESFSMSTKLLSSDGSSTATGMIPIDTLMSDIEHTVKTTIEASPTVPSWWISGTTSISLAPVVADNRLTILLSLNAPGAVTAVFYTIQITATLGSIWRVLGFQGTHQYTAIGDRLGTDTFAFAAQRKLPWLYISGTGGTSSGTNLSLWFRNVAGPALDMTPGWKDTAGNDIPAYVRIDGEVFEVDAIESYPRYGVDWFFLTTTGRGKLGSKSSEHYIEAGEDIPGGVQLAAFPGMDLPKAWLSLLIGGSGTKGFAGSYDQGWYGAGADIGQVVDVSTFEDIATARGLVTDNLAVGDSTPLRDLVQGDCIAQGLSIVAGPSGIKLLDVYPPSVADAASAVIALDATNCRTIGKKGIPLDLGEDKIVNDCLAEIRYNNGTGEYGAPIQMIAADSIGTYGRKPRLDMKLRAFGGPGSSKVAREAMQRIQAAYKAPYAVVTVVVTHPDWWSVELGDVVTISHTLVPTISNGLSFVTPGRGIVGLPARVMALTQHYPQAKAYSMGPRGGAVLVVGNISDTQASNWSPSAYCSSIVTDTCTITARYGGLEGAEFKPDDLVLLRSYDGSVQENAEVNSAVTGTIILKATPAIAAPFVIEPREYSEALQDPQRYTAYGTQGTHELPKPGGTDLPRIYR